jgi:hypothetical protein
MNLKLQRLLHTTRPIYRRDLHATLGGQTRSGISTVKREASIGTSIEAKGSVSRDAIRMAIGQVYDYRRFADRDTALAILLPELPRADLVDLIKSAGVSLIYRTHRGFETK